MNSREEKMKKITTESRTVLPLVPQIADAEAVRGADLIIHYSNGN
jgi:hypothetical protein